MLQNTDPGTTLVAGGNEVHAGPPTKGPRMFAFAIGIPKDYHDSDSNDSKKEKHKKGNDNNEMNGYADDNDGEVQHSPVLFHLDMCCILFGITTFEYQDQTGVEEQNNDKKILLE